MTIERSTLTRPLSILHILAPGEAGGLEQVVRSLAIGHHVGGHEVRIVASGVRSDRPHAFVDALTGAGLPVERSTLPFRAYARERAWLRQLCRHYRPDVVHTHGLRADTLHVPVARSLGIPTLATVHGITCAGWRSWLYHQLEWRALRDADAVVAVSRPLIESLAALGIRRDRIVLIPNAYGPCSPIRDRVDARKRLGISADEFVVGWAGRLSREKGADVLIDALSKLMDVPVCVSILGEGGEHENLRARAAARGVASRIRWHGMVPDAGTLMRAFDIFALSSRTEGTPIALLEAVAAGVPVVATSVGGVPDVVSACEAYVVPPENPGAFSAAVRAAYANPSEARMRATAAANRIRAAFRVEPWLERYEELYRRLASGGES